MFSQLDIIGHVEEGKITKLFMKVMYFNLGATLIYWLWVWSITSALRKNIPDTIRDIFPKFRLFLILQFLVMALLIGGFAFVMQYFMQSPQKFINLIFLIMPLGFAGYAINAFFLYYASKIIKTAELQREVTFKDHTNEFIMLWFYPIGVWFIQPLINKLGKRS